MTSLKEEMDRLSSHLNQSTGEQDRVLGSMKEELEVMLQAFTSTRNNMTRIKDEVEQNLDKIDSRVTAHQKDRGNPP